MFGKKNISLNLQSKPGIVDNEAIEELVNRFLNSDAVEDGKEEKLNKEALKLINSSKYWNVNNLEVSSFFFFFSEKVIEESTAVNGFPAISESRLPVTVSDTTKSHISMRILLDSF